MLLADHAYSPPRSLSYFEGGGLAVPVYLSHSGLAAGDWAKVEWVDWSTRDRLLKATLMPLKPGGIPRVSAAGGGLKGDRTFRVVSCTWALYVALRALSNTRTHYDYHVAHPSDPTKVLEVEMKSVQSAQDEALIEGDPPGDVTFVVVSFGAA